MVLHLANCQVLIAITFFERKKMFKKFLPIILLVLSISSLHAQTVAYVTNFSSNNVSVIDTSTNTVAATIPVGNFPSSVVFSPDGTRAYVTNLLDRTISAIDTASNAVTATINLGGGFLASLAITPDGQNLYVPDENGVVHVVSTATNSVTATIPCGTSLQSVAITPDGAHAYALGEGTVSVIDIASNTVVTTIAVNFGPFAQFPLNGIAITPGGGAAYVGGGANPIVSVIATASNTVATTISIPGSAPAGIVVTPDGKKVYVADTRNNGVDVIDAATNTVIGSTIPVGSQPVALAITPDGAFLYVTQTTLFANSVAVISTATNAVVGSVAVGITPTGVAISNLNVPFASFPAPTPSNTNNPNRISLSGSLSLGANSPGLDFAHQPMTLTVGGFSLQFPAGTVTQVGNSSQQHFTFSGTLNGLSVTFDLIGNSPNFTYSFTIQGKNVGTQVGPNPVTVTLKIGRNSGSSTVNF